MWNIYEAFQEWEVRVTGIKAAYRLRQTSLDAYEETYPSDPRNASLYHWWSTQAGKVGSIGEHVSSAIESEREIREIIDGPRREGAELPRDVINIPAKLHANKLHWDSLNRSIGVIRRAVTSDNILVPIKIFDRRYRFFLAAQNLRCLFFDFVFPSVLASYAIFMILSS
ncbi:hypothetical protein ACJJID_01360 [Microbulbifer sp. CnH-101-G]|uniref:hypothetical protein n=1 Tax=Microbulbifer sp. CnH-101-G TaxID=3243393 RepID=UPI004039D04C